MNSSNKEKEKKRNIIVILFILFFILFSINIILQPIQSFKPWYDWYKTYDPEKKYNCIPLNLMAYYYGPEWLYKIVKNFTKESTVFPYEWQIDYIMSLMRGMSAGYANGPLTPETLCSTLVPSYGSDFWKNIGSTINIPPNSTFNTEKIINRWPETVNEWKALMTTGDGGGWGIGFDPATKTTTPPKDWSGEGTNFLFLLWGIPYNSPLVQSFITGRDIQGEGKLPTYPNALQPLFGLSSAGGFGGWYGFLRAGDDWGGRGSLQVQAYVWGTLDIMNKKFPNTNKKDTKKKCNGTSIATQAISTGGMGAMIGMMGGPIGAAIGGLIGAAAGGLLSASSQKCI